jgi:hypothetical protein
MRLYMPATTEVARYVIDHGFFGMMLTERIDRPWPRRSGGDDPGRGGLLLLRRL